MNVDHILAVFNDGGVRYILIGGVNFLLRHAPILTFDIDFWIEDSAENLPRCEAALARLEAHWGSGESDWGPVAQRNPGWLGGQEVFCLSSPYGAIDIFRRVQGLDDWSLCFQRADRLAAAAGVPFVSLSDEDMLRYQELLPEGARREDRVRALREALRRKLGRGQPDRVESA